MERRFFAGDSSVSVLGVGCGRIGSIQNPVPMREIRATLAAAVDAGITLFDTADIYGQGDSERELGRLKRMHKDRLFVMTKVGGRHGRFAGAMRFAKPLLRKIVRSRTTLRSVALHMRTASVSHTFYPSNLRRAVSGSSRRLQLDQLDGLLLHNPSAETLGQAEIADFLHEVLRNGHAARVGVSLETLEEVEAAVAIDAVTMLQMPFPLAMAMNGSAILELIKERNIAVFVRNVLSHSMDQETTRRSPPMALSHALEMDFITSVIIGISTRRHLNEILAVRE